MASVASMDVGMAGMKLGTPATANTAIGRFSTKQASGDAIHLAQGLADFLRRELPAAMIGETLPANSLGPETVHLPRLAEETAAPAVFRTLALVVCHQ